MEINNINQVVESLRIEREKLQKIQKVHQINPVRKEIYKDKDQEKDKANQNKLFEEIFETELKRLKKLEE